MNCTNETCNGQMTLEEASADSGSTPDSHTEIYYKFWECGKCGLQEDFENVPEEDCEQE